MCRNLTRMFSISLGLGERLYQVSKEIHPAKLLTLGKDVHWVLSQAECASLSKQKMWHQFFLVSVMLCAVINETSSHVIALSEQTISWLSLRERCVNRVVKIQATGCEQSKRKGDKNRLTRASSSNRAQAHKKCFVQILVLWQFWIW